MGCISVQGNKAGAEENTADNITQPVYTGHEPAEQHKENERNNKHRYDAAQELSVDACFKLHENSRHHAKYKHGC